MAIEASLVDSAAAAARVPADIARRVLGRHAFAVRHQDRLFANTPDSHAGCARRVQGNQREAGLVL
jgi:hypothetical protein